jgi:hypothetical protein
MMRFPSVSATWQLDGTHGKLALTLDVLTPWAKLGIRKAILECKLLFSYTPLAVVSRAGILSTLKRLQKESTV